MLRSILIYLSKADWAKNIVTHWKLAWKAASRFVAGEDIDDAIAAVKELNLLGINATLDQLGEHTSTEKEASASTNGIIQILEKINSSGVRANVSIKLTQIGLALSDEICKRNLRLIMEKAENYNIFLRIDMEDTPFTDKTIELFLEFRDKGYDLVGLVVQSYLYRTIDDVRRLLDKGVSFRLVKGAYKEPKELAFPKKKDVDQNFDQITKIMLEYVKKSGVKEISADGKTPPVTALGTHDLNRILFGQKVCEILGLPKKCLEVQMLYGIRRDLQERLVAEGYPVRVYVPFGTHWYPYFIRRLAERPANIWFFISNFFRR